MRFLLSLVLASCVVFGLFLAMERLVKGVKWKPEKAYNSQPIEFVRLKREEATQTRERRVPNKPPEPETPPPPRMKLDQALTPPGGTIDVSMPKVDLSGRGRVGSIGGAAVFDPQTTAVIPLARVEPQYPRQALIDGIEGWVEVEFTITAFGTVEDPRVLRAQPKGVFENAALRAILRWKFKPKIENGVPEPFRGNIRLNFDIPEEGTQ